MGCVQGSIIHAQITWDKKAEVEIPRTSMVNEVAPVSHGGCLDGTTGHAQQYLRDNLFQPWFIAAEQNLQVLSCTCPLNSPVGKAHRLFAPEELGAEL